VRLLVDDREQYSPGWKYYEHELRGVPVRLEVGPKDVEKSAVMSVRRLDRRKESIPLEQLATRLPALLEEVQADLFKAAQTFRAANTSAALSIDDLVRHFVTDGRRGFVALPWEDDARLEAEIKERCAATLRCIPLDQARFEGVAPAGKRVALFARAY
jgi:prolyl-tRNA synthetase